MPGGVSWATQVPKLVSAPTKSLAPGSAAQRTYHYELDEELGLLVGRRMAGPHRECVPLIAEAERRFLACAGRKNLPKVHVLLVDADVEPPDPRARAAYATASTSTSGLFVVVSASPLARMAALSIAAMKGEAGAMHAGYADFELAVDWVDRWRPGIRFRMAAMRARLF